MPLNPRLTAKPARSPHLRAFLIWLLMVGWAISAKGQDIVVKDDFDRDRGVWEFVDSDSWRYEPFDSGDKVLHLFRKSSDYQPPFRSPRHIALLKDVEVESFQMDVDVKSTHEDYDHRDVCLFFGYQSPDRFYYAHLGKRTDDHANQIFIVNRAARTKISTRTTDGTPWDDQWHHVRIVRNARSGQIEVFFDDMTAPVMTATDKTFVRGRIGLGSFDDTAAWDNFVLKALAEE